MNKYDVILDVCKTGSFSKTAHNLNYSQSAISQTIRSFESEMGFPIFKRTNTGVQLIPAAQEVIDSLAVINAEQDHLKRISDTITNAESGVVRLGLFLSFSITYLPKLIKEFQEKYPRIDFQIFTGNQKEIHDLLEQGSIDIAITSEQSVLEFDYSKIIKDEFVIALPPDHPLADYPSISVYDLNNIEYILSGEKFRYEIGSIFENANVHPHYSLDLYDEMVALRFIEAGFGISVFSKFFLSSIPNHADVAIRPFKEHYYRYLVLATNKSHFISASSKLFLAFLETQKF